MTPAGVTAGRRALAGATFLLVAATAAPAQEAAGLNAALSVSTGLEFNDNPSLVAKGAEARSQLRTDLTFSLSSVTRSQALSFGITSGFRAGTDGLEAADPSARLSYRLFSKDTELSLGATYRRAEVNDPLPEDLDDDEDVVYGTGTRQDLSLTLGLETGRTAPFGTTFRLAQRSRHFIGTSSPDLFDTTTTSAGVDLRFRIDPQLTATLSAGGSLFRADNADDTERRSASLGLSAAYEVSPVLSARVGISQDRTETTRAGTRTVAEGTGLSFGVTLARPRGTLGLEFSSRVTESGRRSTLSFNRSQTLRLGSLSYSLGLTRSETGEGIDPVFGLTYVRNGQDSAISVQFQQAYRTNTDGAEVVDGRLALRYTREINAISSLSVNFGLSGTYLQQGVGDVERFEAGLSYRHALGGDWDLVGGTRHVLIREEATPDRTQNVLYVNLEKRFDFRP